MPPEESPEAKFDRLKKQLQDSILRDYPNPERKGCPGGAILRKLAERPWDRMLEDHPDWNHVTHCSECYGEFLAFNNAFRRQAQVRRARVRWVSSIAAVVVLAAAVILGLKQGSVFPKRPQNAELAFAKRTILIPSMERSGNVDEQKPILLERLPLELTVELPIGSKAGGYELQLKGRDRTVLSTGGNAEIHNGTTAFTLRIDLTRIASGNYSLVVRQPPHDWNLYPVVIQ
jgi:hypothetical protein